MKTKIKLLYPFANVMGIFFPIGKLENGGTCEFATEKCLKECCAKRGGKDIVSNSVKKEVYKFFLDNNVKVIASHIEQEMEENNCTILSWFASGDCPSFMTDKIASIINSLNFIQTGISRNHALINKIPVKDDLRFLLTKEKTPKDYNNNLDYMENYNQPNTKIIYAVPNYKLITFDIFYFKDTLKRFTDGCGGGYYTEHFITKKKSENNHYLEMNCKKCYENKTGCFIKI